MINRIDIENFLEINVPVFDVRSPVEFDRGHIPDAINLPLFSNEERAIVGKAFHQKGRDEAVKIGLEKVSVKLTAFIESVQQKTDKKEIRLHCWRGGMRSKSMGWLLDTAGFQVHLLEGGYKSYRRFVLKYFEQKFPLIVIGGMTGSGKTEILKNLKEAGENVIDLEALACHKGSVFGHLGQNHQPSTEFFENLLFQELCNLKPNKPIWIEDESMAIGNIYIPAAFYQQMQETKLIFIERNREQRAKRLVDEYAGFDKSLLKESVDRISRRIGGDHAKRIISYIDNNEFYQAIYDTLNYYDKLYQKDVSKHQSGKIISFKIDDLTNVEIIDSMLTLIKQST